VLEGQNTAWHSDAHGLADFCRTASSYEGGGSLGSASTASDCGGMRTAVVDDGAEYAGGRLTDGTTEAVAAET